MKNINISTGLTAVLFATVLSFGAFGFAPAAHAQYDDFGSDIGSGCCGGSYSTGTDFSYPADYSTASYSTGTDFSYTADYSTPSYSTGTDFSYPADYGSAGYGMTSGYMTGGYSTGYMTGGGYTIGTPVYHTPIATPVVSTPSNTNINTNTCTGNSCNKDDHSVVNIQNPAPVINNNNVVANYGQTQTQYCASGYSGVYPNCYRPQPVVYQQPPVAYNTPYVSLSQVPYTGLDLGFWGSIAYWGAFVLFALFAAYLIAIKRVQNTMANYLKSLLFGSEEEDTETLVPASVETAPAAPTPAPEMPEGDVIDSFIMSQINRARHA